MCIYPGLVSVFASFLTLDFHLARRMRLACRLARTLRSNYAQDDFERGNRVGNATNSLLALLRKFAPPVLPAKQRMR